MLSGEVGPFAEQLALRQGEDAGSLSNQHRIVQATVARSRWDQVTALKNTHRERSNEEGTRLIVRTLYLQARQYDFFLLLNSNVRKM